jgi:hypothetical protein
LQTEPTSHVSRDISRYPPHIGAVTLDLRTQSLEGGTTVKLRYFSAEVRTGS